MSKKPYRKCVFLSRAREVAFWAPKCVLGPKNRFWAPKAPKRQKVALFAPWRPGGASRPQTLIGVMVFHPSEGAKKRQAPFLAPKCVLGRKNALWAQKRTLGRKTPFGRKSDPLAPRVRQGPRARVLGSEYSSTRIRVLEYSDPSTRALGPCRTRGAKGSLLRPKGVFRPKVRFWAQSAFLRPKTHFGAKKGACRFLAPSEGWKTITPIRVWGLLAPPGRQGAKSATFWRLGAFGAQKRFLGPKTHFGAQNATSRARLRNTHFLYGFLLILGAVGAQNAFFAQNCAFPPQSAFLGPKCVFGPQNAFWGQKGVSSLFGPLGRVENHYSYKGLGPAGAAGAPRREKCDFLAFGGFWGPKAVFGPQNAFWGPKRNFPRPAQKHTFSVWFLAHFGGRWGPKCVFGAKSRFLAPKCVLGPKVRFGGKIPLLGPRCRLGHPEHQFSIGFNRGRRQLVTDGMQCS